MRRGTRVGCLKGQRVLSDGGREGGRVGRFAGKVRLSCSCTLPPPLHLSSRETFPAVVYQPLHLFVVIHSMWCRRVFHWLDD